MFCFIVCEKNTSKGIFLRQIPYQNTNQRLVLRGEDFLKKNPRPIPRENDGTPTGYRYCMRKKILKFFVFCVEMNIMTEQNTKKPLHFTAPEAKVLIVDDIPANIRATKELIDPCAVKVYISLNGAKAVEMVQKEHYDLVFMDQIMPEMDGIETIAKIRALKHIPGDASGGTQGDYFQKLPIVLLTANATEESEEALAQKGINGWLTKPVDPAALFDTIEKLLPAEKIIPL